MSASINIWGACVSRDIFPKSPPHLYSIQQYVSFTNPMSLYLKRDSIKNVISNDDLENIPWGSDFAKRCFTLDCNGESFNYLKQKKSQWLILDLADFRMDLLSLNDNYCTYVNLYDKNKEFFKELVIKKGLNDNIQRCSLFTTENDSLSLEKRLLSFCLQDYYDCLEWFLEQILNLYRPDQIILHEYYLCEEYITKTGNIKTFGKTHLVHEKNLLLKKLYLRCKDKLAGCQIIEMPDFIIGDESHKWGCHPLHYHSLYYEYAYKSLNAIIYRNEDINTLRTIYSIKAKEIYSEALKNTIDSDKKRYMYDLKKGQIYSKCFSKIIKNQDTVTNNIKQIIRDNNIQTIAFWGDFIISEVLAALLKQLDVKLTYIVCNWNHGTADVVIPTKAEKYPSVDAFVICDVMNIKSKSDYCKSKTSSPIYSVFDFLPQS